MLRIRKVGGISSPPDDAIGLPRVIRMRKDASPLVASPLRLNFGFFLAVEANA
jgi:hypothetical protein